MASSSEGKRTLPPQVPGDTIGTLKVSLRAPNDLKDGCVPCVVFWGESEADVVEACCGSTSCVVHQEDNATTSGPSKRALPDGSFCFDYVFDVRGNWGAFGRYMDDMKAVQVVLCNSHTGKAESRGLFYYNDSGWSGDIRLDGGDGSDASATSLDVRMDLDRRHSVGEWDELMRKGGAGAVTR